MPPTLVGYVNKKDTEQIQRYLKSHNLGINKYREKVGEGVSQCLGIVGKRCLPPDLSRQSWLHPRLHKLLHDFGEQYVRPHINWTSVQVNVNFSCAPHKDVGNMGESYIVGLGNYVNGELMVEDFPYDINYRGLLFDGSQRVHSTRDWRGYRVTLVYHTLEPKARFGGIVPAWSDFEAVEHEGKWKMRRVSDGALFWKGHGLPHPLKNKTKESSDAQTVN